MIENVIMVLTGLLMNKTTNLYKMKGDMYRITFVLIDLQGKLLITDREFIGKEWFAFLVEFKLNFIVRLRKEMYQGLLGIDQNSYHNLEKKALKKGYSQAIISLEKQYYKVEMWKTLNKTEPIIYLITNILNQRRIGKQYAKRWKIEYCFKHLKTNGRFAAAI